jgi:hypothetical protein
MARIHIVGGGTVMHVRNHLALAAPAYGTTARAIAAICARRGEPATLVLTRMADASSPYETNDDVARLARELVADPSVRIVFWNPAVCDYRGLVDGVPSGPKAERLHTSDGARTMELVPADKVVASIRRERKDIFLVAWKTTAGATEDAMYAAGLRLLKSSSINLVMVNDPVTRMNMVVTPEEARYHVTGDRAEALEGLVEMALLRARGTFTRSTVVPDSEAIAWRSDAVAANLRAVVDHCIRCGAYRPLDTPRGRVTAGHFAARGADGRIVTSRRWSDFNDLDRVGMVLIEARGDGEVIAWGGKPSVGGQSQRIIFATHPRIANIVHVHCPLRPGADVPVRPQRPFECGSHECGRNTADGLRELEPGIWAVMLDQHGPNVCFAADVDPARVIDFLERNFDLAAKTGGGFA